jgi:O-antigen ligase
MNYELIRPYATFPHPNVLGGFLALTLPFIIDQYLTNKNNSHRFISPSPYLHIYYLLVISLGIITLILTFSRTAWVAFILFMVLLHITDYSKRRISYPLSFAYGIGILILSFFIGNLFLPYFQKLTPTSESVFVRNDLNLAALSMVMPNDKIINHNSLHLPILSSNRLPILSLFTGVGLGNFLVELPKIYPHRDIFFLQPVHNIYLFVLSETGLIGFMIFLWSIYKGLWRKKLFIIHYSLFIILLIGLVDHYPLTLQQGQLLLTMLISFALFTYP